MDVDKMKESFTSEQLEALKLLFAQQLMPTQQSQHSSESTQPQNQQTPLLSTLLHEDTSQGRESKAPSQSPPQQKQAQSLQSCQPISNVAKVKKSTDISILSNKPKPSYSFLKKSNKCLCRFSLGSSTINDQQSARKENFYL